MYKKEIRSISTFFLVIFIFYTLFFLNYFFSKKELRFRYLKNIKKSYFFHRYDIIYLHNYHI